MTVSRINRSVTATAGDGKRMTLGELRAFVTEMDQAGAADITVRIAWGGGLKELRATAARFGEPEPR